MGGKIIHFWGQIINFWIRDYFWYDPHEPLLMMWSCVPLPVPFDWLLSGDYFIPQRLKWYQFNIQIAQVFVQHFRLGLRVPILLQFPPHVLMRGKIIHFLGQIINFWGRDYFWYDPHEPLLMMWSCVLLPVPFDWLLAGDYFIPQRLKWYQFISHIAQVFVQHFHLGLRICPFCCSSPITQYVVWHAAKCKWLFTPALLVVAMVCLLYQETKYMAIDRNTNTNICTKYVIKYKYRYKHIIRLCWWR